MKRVGTGKNNSEQISILPNPLKMTIFVLNYIVQAKRLWIWKTK